MNELNPSGTSWIGSPRFRLGSGPVILGRRNIQLAPSKKLGFASSYRFQILSRRRPRIVIGAGAASMRNTALKTSNASAAVLTVVSLHGPAVAEPLKLSDLQGAQIRATVVLDRQTIVDGKPSSDRVANNWLLKIDGRTLHSDFFATVTGPNGTHTNPLHQNSFTIGEPTSVQFLGSGNRVWIFDKGKLVSIRSYREGAFRLVISLTRNSGAFGCTAAGAFAREHGGSVEFSTEESGRNIRVVSSKTLQTSCQVIR
jgi:hypothetical protein